MRQAGSLTSNGAGRRGSGDHRRERVDDRLILTPLFERFGQRVVAQMRCRCSARSTCARSPPRRRCRPGAAGPATAEYSARMPSASGVRAAAVISVSTSRAFVRVLRPPALQQRGRVARLQLRVARARCSARSCVPPRRTSAARARRSRRASAAGADRRPHAARTRRWRRWCLPAPAYASASIAGPSCQPGSCETRSVSSGIALSMLPRRHVDARQRRPHVRDRPATSAARAPPPDGESPWRGCRTTPGRQPRARRRRHDRPPTAPRR